jgi:hypothetical protein
MAFFWANASISGSVLEQRSRRLPEASQKARPNLIPGTALTMASCRSSTVLMKWDWPRMKLISSGFSIVTVLVSIRKLLKHFFSFYASETHIANK